MKRIRVEMVQYRLKPQCIMLPKRNIVENVFEKVSAS
jgi:hypothetical protein